LLYFLSVRKVDPVDSV